MVFNRRIMTFYLCRANAGLLHRRVHFSLISEWGTAHLKQIHFQGVVLIAQGCVLYQQPIRATVGEGLVELSCQHCHPLGSCVVDLHSYF